MVNFKPFPGQPRLLIREGPHGPSEPLFLWIADPKKVPGGDVDLETSWSRHLGAYVFCGVPATDLSAFETLIENDHKAMQDKVAEVTGIRPWALFVWYEDPDAAIAAGPSADRPMIVLQRSMTAVYRRAFSLRNQYFDFQGDGVISIDSDDAGHVGIKMRRPGHLFWHYGLMTGGNLDAPDRAMQLSLEVAGPAFVPMEGPHTGSLCYNVKIDPSMMVTYGGDVRFFTGNDRPIQRRYPVLDFWDIKESLAYTVRLNPAAPCDPDRTRFVLSSTEGGYPTSLISVLGRRLRLNPTADGGWTFQPIRRGLSWPKDLEKVLGPYGKAAPELYYLSPVGDWTVELDSAAADTSIRILCGANGTEFLNARPGDLLRFEANHPASAPTQTTGASDAAKVAALGATLAEESCRTSWVTMIPADRPQAGRNAGSFPFGYFAQPLSSVTYGLVTAGHVDDTHGDLALLGAYGVQLSALGDGSSAFPIAPFSGITRTGDVSGLGGRDPEFAELPLNEPIETLDFAGFERTVISPVRQAAVTPNQDSQGQGVGPRFVADAPPPLASASAPRALLGTAAPGPGAMALGAAPEDGLQGLTPQGLVGTYLAANLAWRRLIFARDMSKGPTAEPAQRQDFGFENGLNPLLGEALMSDSLFLVVSNTANIGPTASAAEDATGIEIKFQNSFLVPGSRRPDRPPEDIFKITVDIAAPGEEIRSVLIAKYVTGQSIKDLVDNVGRWTKPADFNDKVAGEYTVQKRLQRVIDEALAAVGGDDADAGVKNGGARWLAAFAAAVQDANWTGILAIDCPVPGGGLPEELQALRGGMTEPLRAHHIGVAANQVKFSKVAVPGNDGTGAALSIDVAESAIFGLIRYPPLGAKPPTFKDPDAPQDYLVRELDILLANSAIADFFCEVHLLLNTLFGRSVLLSKPTKRASGEQLQNNVIPIFGYYADHEGKKRFSFVASRTSLYAMKQPETEPVRRVLAGVRIDSAAFRVTDQTKEGGGQEEITRIRARFGLVGGLLFNLLAGATDIFGYGEDNPLTVAGMAIDVQFALKTDGSVEDRKIAFSLADMRVDKDGASRPRAGSIQANMPLSLHAFRSNVQKPEAGLNAGALNATAILSRSLGDELTASPHYVLHYALPFGDFGKLASTRIAFTANVYLGWGPQETSPGDDGVGLFLELPLPVPGVGGFNLQGVLRTNFGTINLDRVIRKRKKDGKEQPLYVLTFSNVTVGFLAFKLPPGEMVNFYVFGDPESDRPAHSNIAWLLAVKGKDGGGNG